MNDIKHIFRYSSKGLVLGNYWDGGKGTYNAKPIFCDTKELLLSKANDMLKSGSLDSGMGYKSLIGALLIIKCVDTIIINDKKYSNISFEEVSIGILTDEELYFMTNYVDNYSNFNNNET